MVGCQWLHIEMKREFDATDVKLTDFFPFEQRIKKKTKKLRSSTEKVYTLFGINFAVFVCCAVLSTVVVIVVVAHSTFDEQLFYSTK